MTLLNDKRICWLGVGALWTMLSGVPALADDTELFVGNNQASQQNPNILFIVDNSGSMAELVLTQENFQANVVYPSQGCDANRVYWRTGTGDPPTCGTDRYFNASALKCNAAATAFTTSGFYTDTMAQYDPSWGQRRWETINSSQKNRAVECQDDRGVHGDGVNLSNRYARNGANANGYWGTAGNEISWGQTPANQTYTIYSGNYLNWAYGPTGFQTRLDVVKDVAGDLLDSVTGVNVGLIHFNDVISFFLRSEGGQVAYAMEDIATARAPMQAAINALDAETFTPLSETLYEAALYYKGAAVDFGNPDSVAASRDPMNSALYNTPLDYTCQKNYIVLLTDGEPTGDTSADDKITAMTDGQGGSFNSLVGGSCDAENYPPGFNPSGGDCLDDLAEFLYEGDFSPLAGQQNITTYTVGFTVDLPILADTAERGGGEYYTADDTASLSTALSNIVTSILSTNTSFTAPTVAVNAFNRTENLSDLFVSVFRPAAQLHWPGNLKKYRLRASDGQIVDANGAVAVDPATGFFADGARSFWSPTADGADVEKGGAANLIPPPASRLVYTYLGGGDLTAAGNRIAQANAALTDAVLNTGGAGDPTRAQVIDFINGLDLPDTDQDNNTNEPRTQIGDPLHGQPVTVVYGPDIRDGLILMGTNDGYLHAFDLESGVEQWAFIPPDFLDDQVALYEDESAATKHYGIDGNLRVHMVANNNGIIEPGEKVYLYFGMRRGGDFYYGLDISNPASPRVMFRLDGTTLPGIGQTWSTPVPTRLDIQGAMQNPEKSVLVIAGGYEPDQDNATASTDTIGNSIYIVDSLTGALLWHGSRDGLHKDFNAAGKAMDYSIPADITVIDLDGNGFADRMYAADMGGQVWRFDISNGQSPANLVAGGVIAQLGAAGIAGPPVALARRFYNAPDIAFVNNEDYNFTHVGIGSGHRAHPLSTQNQDRFYALRDYGFGKKTQLQFDAAVPTRDGDLLPITTVGQAVPQGHPGWRFDLDDGGWIGEKVLSAGRVFENKLFFSTFRPAGIASCDPQLGVTRLYQMSLVNGTPLTNLDGSADPTVLTTDDWYVEGQGGIPTTTQVIFLPADQDNDGIPDSIDPDDDNDGVLDIDEPIVIVDTDGDGIPDDADDDDDNDGIPDIIDDDDDGDGILDVDEEEEEIDDGTPLVCTDRICVPADFDNDPVRTVWTQDSLD